MTKKEKPRFSISFDEETYTQIVKISEKTGKSYADVVRSLVQESLNVKVTTENMDFICSVIRSQLKSVLQPSVDRLAALSAKSCVQSATASFLTAETIAKFVPEHLQVPVKEEYEAARKKAVLYTKQKYDDGEN